MGQRPDQLFLLLLHLLFFLSQLPLGGREVVDALCQPGQLVVPLQRKVVVQPVSPQRLHPSGELVDIGQLLPQQEEKQDDEKADRHHRRSSL